MKVIKSIKELQIELSKHRGHKQIGFVPTMGALHTGHLSLIKQSKSDNQISVVSIYLNSTQFNNSTDLVTYPNSLAEDLEILKELHVDFVFLPDYEQIYPDDYQYRINETSISQELCGKGRPGHFDGVLTVVLKLFNLVKPTRAYFGEKDYQQLELIRGMVKAFFLDVEIIACPVVRDSKGLALSSRNRKLNEFSLQKAQLFAQKLKTEVDITRLQKDLSEAGIVVDYIKDKNKRRFAAVKIEDVRLIDNVEI